MLGKYLCLSITEQVGVLDHSLCNSGQQRVILFLHFSNPNPSLCYEFYYFVPFLELEYFLSRLLFPPPEVSMYGIEFSDMDFDKTNIDMW